MPQCSPIHSAAGAPRVGALYRQGHTLHSLILTNCSNGPHSKQVTKKLRQIIISGHVSLPANESAVNNCTTHDPSK